MDISVIVPFYKGNQYMERIFCIMRKNAQSAPELELELLIINDSPDCPVVYDEAWVHGFTLRILPNPQNVGIHGSRINGIRAAKGKFVQLLDQDDLLTDGALLSQYRAIGECDVSVANGYDESDTNRGLIYKSVAHQNMVAQERYYCTIGNLIVSPGHCLIRKDAFPELWMNRPIRRNGSDDLLLWMLMMAAGCTWKVNPECLYTHVNTGANVSADFMKMRDSSYEVLEILKENGLISEKRERQFVRRFEMREMYEGKGGTDKLKAMLRYPDLAADLMVMKLRGLVGRKTP